MVLNYMLSMLNQSSRQQYYKSSIQETTRGLLKKLGIPAVKAKEVLINYIQEDEYWTSSTLTRQYQTRSDLRNLIQYLDPVKRVNLYTNYEDEMGEIVFGEMMGTYQELGSYKKRVEKFIRENRNHITIHRMCTNKPISKQELVELEKLLFSIDPTITPEAFERLTEKKPLAKFIRSILGLDINAAKEAFSSVLNSHTLNATQVHFKNTIIDYLSENGTIERNMLFDKPFTEINDQGLVGVFSMEDAGDIIKIIDSVDLNVEVG